MRQFAALGGTRGAAQTAALVTDNGQHILDVTGLRSPIRWRFETEINQWPGVVTVGVFAHQRARVCLLGTAQGVQRVDYGD